MAKKTNNRNNAAKKVEVKLVATYELPNTKSVLKPLMDVGNGVAEALLDGRIDFGEWVKIAFAAIPLTQVVKNLDAFVAETRILNQHEEAREQLYNWFKEDFKLPMSQEHVEVFVEGTIGLAMKIWSYINLAKQTVVAAKIQAESQKK